MAGTSQDEYQAVCSYISTANIWVGKNVLPVVPTTDSDQQYVEFRPHKKFVRGGDVLQFVTSDATQYIGVSLSAL